MPTIPTSLNPSSSLLNKKRLRFVSMYAAVNSRFKSTTDLGITDQFRMSYLHGELVNRKVKRIAPVWLHTWKSGTGGPSINTDGECPTGLTAMTITYAWEMPKINYRTVSINAPSYSALTLNTTNHINYGSGSGGDGGIGIATVQPGGLAVGNFINASDVTFNDGASQTFPKRYNFWFRQHTDVGVGGVWANTTETRSYGAGQCERVKSSASTLVANVSGTGRFSASANTELMFNSPAPNGYIGEVDDTADPTPYICIGIFGNSLQEGPTTLGTDPTTGTLAWGNDAVDSAGAWKDDGWAHEWARSKDNIYGIMNLGCSSWSAYAATQASNRRDGFMTLASFCDAVLINFACNDNTLGRTLAEIKADHITLITELKRKGVKVILQTPNPFGASGNAVLEQFSNWVMDSQAEHGADLMLDVRPFLGDYYPVTPGWGYKSGYSSDTVHLNATTGKTAMIAGFTAWFDVNLYSLIP